MMLELADNGRRGQGSIRTRPKKIKTIYNPKTGIATIISMPSSSQPVELSGLFSGLKKKMKGRKELKAKKAEVRQASKLKRFEKRQEAKTGRQEERFKRKDTRLKKRTATQENRLARKVGRKAETEAKSQAKIDKINQSYVDAAQESTYDESSDSIPDTSDVTGGDYMMNPNNPEEFTAYENVDESEFEEEPQGELSAGGLWGTVANVVKGAAGGIVNAVAPNSKVGNYLLKVKDSKTGQFVTRAVNAGQEFQLLKNENVNLKLRVKQLQNERLVWAAGSAVVGFGVGRISKK